MHETYSNNKQRGGMGYWRVNYTGTTSFLVEYSYQLVQKEWVFYWILIGCLQTCVVQISQPIVLIYRSEKFVSRFWRCISNYHPLHCLKISAGSKCQMAELIVIIG